jgi:hypothetical protein
VYIPIVLCISIVVAFLPLSCKKLDPCVEKEIIRKISQDRAVDFVVVEKDCGATTSTSTQVFIVPRGKPPGEHDSVFIADHVSGLKVDWIAPKQLSISYANARIFNFTY